MRLGGRVLGIVTAAGMLLGVVAALLLRRAHRPTDDESEFMPIGLGLG